MHRALFLLVPLAACAAWAAPSAHAHGGRFRPPKMPPIVPQMPVPPPTTPRRPGFTPPITPGAGAPTTPRPLTPGGSTRPGMGRGRTPPGRGASGPARPGAVPTPTPSPAVTGRGPGATRGRPRPATQVPGGTAMNDWGTWWALNRWAYLPDRRAVRARRMAVVTPSSTGGVDPVDDVAGWEARRVLLAESVVVPRLRGLLDQPDLHPDVRAAALLALARTASDDAAVRTVLASAEDPDATPLVRESATLALGLFRRSAGRDRLSGLRADVLRRRLLRLLDDAEAPTRTRAMAAFALGVLADQPYGTAATRDGRVVAHALWERLRTDHADREVPVAILTALGHQPPAGAPEAVREGLQRIALGKRVHRTRWSDAVRAHALTARLRLGGPGSAVLLLRTLTSRRTPDAVRRAAFLGLAENAAAFDAAERAELLEAWHRAVRREKNAFTEGLAHVALGRLLAADLAADPDGALCVGEDGAPWLVRRFERAKASERGFLALGLGLAVRDADADADAAARVPAAGRLGVQAERVFLAALTSSEAAETRAACAVALGLLGSEAAVPVLARMTARSTVEPALRRRAALALAQIGRTNRDVIDALVVAVAQPRSRTLSQDAALALAIMGAADVGRDFVQDLAAAGSGRAVGQMALALGRLGDLRAVLPLLAVAGDADAQAENRAIAIASLGLLLDPERRPSLSRLQVDANYPARTETLLEVFDIL